LAKVAVVQVYAPTEIAPGEEKDIFYDQLQDVLQEVPSFDIKVVLGNFNAKLYTDRRDMHATIGLHGSAYSTNDNGERLLTLRSTSNLSIGNTFFAHKRIHRITWTSPDGFIKNEIDYVCKSCEVNMQTGPEFTMRLKQNLHL